MLGDSMRENRETQRVSGSSTPDRLVKATSYTASMHASGESHRASTSEVPEQRCSF